MKVHKSEIPFIKSIRYLRGTLLNQCYQQLYKSLQRNSPDLTNPLGLIHRPVAFVQSKLPLLTLTNSLSSPLSAPKADSPPTRNAIKKQIAAEHSLTPEAFSDTHDIVSVSCSSIQLWTLHRIRGLVEIRKGNNSIRFSVSIFICLFPTVETPQSATTFLSIPTEKKYILLFSVRSPSFSTNTVLNRVVYGWATLPVALPTRSR